MEFIKYSFYRWKNSYPISLCVKLKVSLSKLWNVLVEMFCLIHFLHEELHCTLILQGDLGRRGYLGKKVGYSSNITNYNNMCTHFILLIQL